MPMVMPAITPGENGFGEHESVIVKVMVRVCDASCCVDNFWQSDRGVPVSKEILLKPLLMQSNV